eukprot:CAMPEP_0194098382 /NCGR_PEP_ID=MMETSP0149-20130528/58351_1 /TAXON_ID=122233 /ORGANISM="Chaetoceros debilis, Strain MM31A-1" /LENGTH=97 /DNA_ID=CAMNT_0038784427 /DNA_START=872 /DNA_END=1166 /DNA_ORIENTATION=-
MPLKGLGEGDEHLNEYYENASGVKRLGPSGIKVPYLCITSMNEPFIPEPAMPPKHIINDENDNIFLAIPPNSVDTSGTGSQPMGAGVHMLPYPSSKV